MKTNLRSGSLIGGAIAVVALLGSGASSHGQAALATARDGLFSLFSPDYLDRVAQDQLDRQQERLLDAEAELEQRRDRLVRENQTAEPDALPEGNSCFENEARPSLLASVSQTLGLRSTACHTSCR